MPNCHFVSYAAGSFRKNIKLNIWFAKKFLRTKTTCIFTNDDLKKTKFYSDNQALLDELRGAGYWAWKPYYILQRLNDIPENDILIYQDCGFGYRFKNFIYPRFLIKFTQKFGSIPGVFVPENGMNYQWTKKDAFVFLDCDSEKYWHSPQIQATISFWRNDEHTRSFVTDWMNACCQRRLVSDDVNVNGLPNHESFRDHRHDQSLLTNLAIKYELAIPNEQQEYIKVNKSLSMIELHFRAKSSIYYRLILNMLLSLQNTIRYIHKLKN